MTDENTEMREGIAKRDLRKGLRLALRELSRKEVLAVVQDYLWKRPEP